MTFQKLIPVCFCLAFAASIFSGCGGVASGSREGDSAQVFIAQGQPLNREHPGYSSVVKILYSNGVSCTGTLVERRFVLTAAHCVKGETAWVTFRPIGSMLHAVTIAASGVQHPGYRNQTSPENPDYGVDLGILKLQQDAPDTYVPVTLPSQEWEVPPSFHLAGVGFGVTENGISDEVPHIGFYGNYRQIDLFSRVHLLQFQNFLGSPRACVGDSGGPLFDVGLKVLIGVDSFGTSLDLQQPNNCNDDLNFNYVFLPRYMDFIKASLVSSEVPDSGEAATPPVGESRGGSAPGASGPFLPPFRVGMGLGQPVEQKNCYSDDGRVKVMCFFAGRSGNQFLMLQSLPRNENGVADITQMVPQQNGLQGFWNFLVNRPSAFQGTRLGIVDGQVKAFSLEAKTAWNAQGNPVAWLARNGVVLLPVATLHWPALASSDWDAFVSFPRVVNAVRNLELVSASQIYIKARAPRIEAHLFRLSEDEGYYFTVFDVPDRGHETTSNNDVVRLVKHTTTASRFGGRTVHEFEGSLLRREANHIVEDIYVVQLVPDEGGGTSLRATRNGRTLIGAVAQVVR